MAVTDSNVLLMYAQIFSDTIPFRNNHYNVTGTSSFLYPPFDCSGSEQSLLDCQRQSNIRNLLTCTDTELAGVTCSGSKH